MGDSTFVNTQENNQPDYAIWHYDPMGFQNRLDALRGFYSKLPIVDGPEHISSYIDLFESDIRQYLQHLLNMAPFSRSQVSLYNIICGTVHTTRDLNRIVAGCEWAECQLPESFALLITDGLQLGLSPGEILHGMKTYGCLIVSLAESFLGNDRRRIPTLFDAENIYNLFTVVAEPFIAKHRLEPWVQLHLAES